MHRTCEPIGLVRAARCHCFQCAYHGIVRYRPPDPCEFGFILSCASSSSESITASFQHSTRKSCAPSLGFFSPSRHQFLESTVRQDSQSLPMFRPQRFSHSRRFPPPSTLQAYFILLPRTRFTLQGLFPAAKPIQLVAVLFPRVVRRLSPPAELPQLSSSGHPNFREFIRAAIRRAKQAV
jgi:hypothetical protein